jgi:hypothetical protein
VLEKTKRELLLNGENLITLPGPKQGNFYAIDKKFKNLC